MTNVRTSTANTKPKVVNSPTDRLIASMHEQFDRVLHGLNQLCALSSRGELILSAEDRSELAQMW